jgi:hypothetical protein
MSYLHYLCLLAYSGVQHILSCVIACLRFVYPMLPVSLCCQFLYVASFSVLPVSLCCQSLCVASFSMLPVSLCCQFLYVASFSVLPVSLGCLF